MIPGITIRADNLMPPGRAALTRDGLPISIGTFAQVMELYRPGDVIVVSEDLWEGLQAQFARDVTPSAPRQALTPEAGDGD